MSPWAGSADGRDVGDLPALLRPPASRRCTTVSADRAAGHLLPGRGDERRRVAASPGRRPAARGAVPDRLDRGVRRGGRQRGPTHPGHVGLVGRVVDRQLGGRRRRRRVSSHSTRCRPTRRGSDCPWAAAWANRSCSRICSGGSIIASHSPQLVERTLATSSVDHGRVGVDRARFRCRWGRSRRGWRRPGPARPPPRCRAPPRPAWIAARSAVDRHGGHRHAGAVAGLVGRDVRGREGLELEDARSSDPAPVRPLA